MGWKNEGVFLRGEKRLGNFGGLVKGDGNVLEVGMSGGERGSLG